ncbi:MAG TPA: M20/M25/M40 family metallo-hydrolase [Thermoanaerobaculia bacterium]|jgi:putative aminopeptidase FrvX|nr:M20/M25/M40 family metallo-hydrolase [Thermoanaerobaculia bacterium]
MSRTAVLVLALLLVSCGAEPEPPPPPRRVVPLHGEAIDVGKAMAHIRNLSIGIGPRPTGTEAEARAAGYLERQLASWGYRVQLQPVPLPDGGASANVVALPPGLDPAAERHLLVGAHYDTVPTSPGANDNASGVAVLLEVARILAARPAKLPVVFVVFGGEEGRPGPKHLSLAGSLHYTEALPEAEHRNLVAMLNLDMIGHGDAVLCTLRINMKKGMHQRLLRLANELGVPAREYFTPQMSDSVPFASHGIETGWLWTGVESAYHSPKDTVEKITPESIDWSGRLALAVLRSYE